MRVIVATRNRHKLIEFSRILGPLGYELVSQDEICPGIEVEEDGATFLENARKKAVEIFRRTGLPTIADDSGLCVDALGGAPGVHSARYADEEGEGHNDKANNRKLLRELKDVPMERRTARFVSAISFVLGEDDLVECQGFCEGHIAFEEQGDNGFGYDPLFLVGGGSFAAIPGEEKDRVSHRGNALRKLQGLLEARAEPVESRLEKQLGFILEVDKEKNIFRQTHLSGNGRNENDAEHAWHMALMAYLLREYANEKVDILRVMLMCLIHDVVEIDAGDTYAYDEEGLKTQKAREAAAKERIYSLLPGDQKEKLTAIFDEFEEGRTPEARFAKAMDNLQPLLLNHSNHGGDWREHRIAAKQVYARQAKTEEGSKVLYRLADKLIRENIEKGSLIG